MVDMALHLIGAQAAANRLGVSRSTVQRLAARGVLVPVHRGNGIRGGMLFDEADILAYQAKVQLVHDLHADAGLDTTRDEVAEDFADTILTDVQATRRDTSTSDDERD